ncbi:LpqB family beta-propeller domain-containing protein [Rhizohabitans arisaemae]|uniref:LpqB family beta-propeller domain-containing protein n=1 Tax=Rhizohabitans arisaemae TaxID=2720610 RepID=UPI0024B1BF2C|nr:LpqB family beta-propeller domain-containing protein [Rhizohabitans arisaemae]
MRSRVGCAIAVTVALLVSGGCAGVPTGGVVMPDGDTRSEGPESEPYIRVIAPTPGQGWIPTQIVEGFLAASASFDDPQHSVARRYLTDKANRAWAPQKEATVYESPEGIQLVGKEPLPTDAEVHVALRAKAVASITKQGSYLALERQDAPQDFRLVRVGQEWRIDGLPKGLWLTPADLRRSYRPIDLHFFDHYKSRPVVDTVYDPISPDTDLATMWVKRLLEGPTKSLRGAVWTAFPEGTTLRREIGRGEGNTFVVDLGGAARSVRSSSETLKLMAAQLVWTLQRLKEWDRIELQIDGVPMRVGSDGAVDRQDFRNDLPSTPPDLYYVNKGKVHRTRPGDQGRPVAGDPVSGEAGHGKREVSHVTAHGNQVAALADGKEILVAELADGARWERRIKGTRLTAPSWDVYSSLWVADNVEPYKSRVLRWYGGPGGLREVETVAAPELGEGEVVALRISRDGMRAAVVLRTARKYRVLVGTVFRDGYRTRLGEFRELGVAVNLQEVSDIAWQDDANVVVLAATKSALQLYRVPIFGPGVTVLTPPTGTETIAVFNSESLAAGSRDDQVRIWNKDEEDWDDLEIQGGSPSYPLS